MTEYPDITLDIRGRPDQASARLIIAAIGPVVDAHHHLWDLQSNHYPWLQEAPIKTHFGDYNAIRRDYLPEEFLHDVKPTALAVSVHIEAHWRGGTDPAGESAWLATQAARHGLPNVIMGAADLCSPDLSATLDAHQLAPQFRGIRVMSMGRGAPEGAALYRDATFQRGLALLFDRGLCVDLQAPPATHEAVAELADLFPQGRFAVIHCGLPLDRSANGLADWRRGVTQLAQASNVYMKLSGLPMTDQSWSCASFAPLVRHICDTFGSARMMFGSNFPVDRLFSDFPTLLAGYVAALGQMDQANLRAIFHDTAQAFYQVCDEITHASLDMSRG